MSKNVKSGIVVALTLILVGGWAFAKESTDSQAGTAAAPFLKNAQSARAAGMGEAFTAVADDASAPYWNPAGATQLKHWQVTAMYNKWFVEMNGGFVAGIVPVSKLKGALGGQVIYFNSGDTPVTDANGDDKGQKAGWKDLAVGITYARKIDVISVGANAKYINQSVSGVPADTSYSSYKDYSRGTVAFDVGGLYKFADLPLSLGLVFQNLGPSFKGFIDTGVSEKLPLTFKLGVAYKLISKGDHNAKLSLDLGKPNDNKFRTNVGGEYWYANTIAGRVGYKGLGAVDNKALGGGIAGITAGLGVRYSDFQLDYAIVPYGDLETTHRVSLTFNFGAASAKKEKASFRREAEEKARLAAEELRKSLAIREQQKAK